MKTYHNMYDLSREIIKKYKKALNGLVNQIDSRLHYSMFSQCDSRYCSASRHHKP